MIVPRHHVAPSQIAGAGKGLWLDEPVARGAVIIAPDNVHTVWPESKLRGFAAGSIEVESSVRWFERWFSITPEWSDECFVNHSFEPSALWHLGFVFAGAELAAGTEITVDYRLLIGEGEKLPFRDVATGREIVGHEWREALRVSTAKLLEIV